MDRKPTTSNTIKTSFYEKFLQNEDKIRKLATADPDSYAAVVVKSVDHFVMGRAMLKLESKESRHKCYNERILKEFSESVRETEIFATWTFDLVESVKTMAKEAIKSEGGKKSDLDRYARICFGMLSINDDRKKAIKFLDECRKKYPTEIFFYRIYCYIFTFTNDFESSLKASDEALKLFPTCANILNARAQALRMMADVGNVDYRNWSRTKKQIDAVKEALKDYLKGAPKDHRHFADNNYFISYLAYKYAAPSAQMCQSDLLEINVYFQNGLNAEKDIIPCFLPFTAESKAFVEQYVTFHPRTDVYIDDKTCTIDMTTHGMPGRPKEPFHIDNMTFNDMREPPKRRIDVCVAHRRRLQNMISDTANDNLRISNEDGLVDSAETQPPANIGSNDFEELILYQLRMDKKSQIFTSKVFPLTVAEDFVYHSGLLEAIVADTTGDVIKLQLDLGVERSDCRTVKQMMAKYRFGTVWQLINPDFHMENRDKNTMYLRATPESLIPTNDGQNTRKCRLCFKALYPGHTCAKCKFAAYCGKKCQIQDWKFIKHNLICSEAYKNFYL